MTRNGKKIQDKQCMDENTHTHTHTQPLNHTKAAGCGMAGWLCGLIVNRQEVVT